MTPAYTDEQIAEDLVYKIRGGLSYLDSAGHKITYTHPRLADHEAIYLLASALREDK